MTPVIFFREDALFDYLRSRGRGMLTKDYEFLVSIVLCRFHRKKTGISHVVGFEIRPEQERTLPKTGQLSIDDLADILQRQIQENTPIDVVIAGGEIDGKTKQGQAYQIKRLGARGVQLNTDVLVAFINNVYRKYARVTARLVLVLETDQLIDFTRVRKEIRMAAFPFDSVMFMAVSAGKILIGEIWPNEGYDNFEPKEFFHHSNSPGIQY
jgi:hypothetical protein